MFLQVSVCPHRGGMHGFIWGTYMVLFGGHAWFYSGGVRGFIRGGVCGFIPGGHVWFYLGGVRGFIRGGMCGFIWGVCMVLFGEGGMHGFIQGGMRGCSRGACVVARGGACVVFSMRYGQWAGGTHPTGMHSCLKCCLRISNFLFFGIH